jgi:hypothetical protein
MTGSKMLEVPTFKIYCLLLPIKAKLERYSLVLGSSPIPIDTHIRSFSNIFLRSLNLFIADNDSNLSVGVPDVIMIAIVVLD